MVLIPLRNFKKLDLIRIPRFPLKVWNNFYLIIIILTSIGDVLVRMMEEKDRDTCRTLFGHSGPVYKVAFDPFKTLLLSSSEDATGEKRFTYFKYSLYFI